MKKLFTLLICTLLLATLCCPVYASADGFTEKALTLISEQITDKDMALLQNSALYQDSMAQMEENFWECPLLKVYQQVYFNLADQPLDAIVAEAQKDTAIDYFVFSQNLTRVRWVIGYQDKEMIGIHEIVTEPIPRFITDIQAIGDTVILKEQVCCVDQVVCFDARTSYIGVVVYLQTDKGVFIRYYESDTSAAIVFTEEEFRVYTAAFLEATSANEGLHIGIPSFGSFVREHSYEELTQATEVPAHRFFLPAIVCVLAVATAVAVLFLRKKKA